MPDSEVKEDFSLQKAIETTHSKEDGTRLHSIEFLFALLPAWKKVKGYGRALYGEITAEDAARVVEHASKVTKFVYSEQPSKDRANSIPVDAYIRFLEHIPTPLFPSLESVHLLFVSAQLHYLPLLFTPSLKHLEISYISTSAAHAIGSFVASLGLEHLELRGSCQLPIEAIDPLLQLRRLRRIELDDVVPFESTTHILRQLAALPLLEDLNIVMRPPAAAPSKPLGSSDNSTGFSKLQRLQITGPLRLIYEAVNLVSSTELRTLQLSAILLPSDSSSQVSVSREEQAQLPAKDFVALESGKKMTEQKESPKWHAEEKELQIRVSERKVANATMRLSEAKSKLKAAEDALLQKHQERYNKGIKRKINRLQTMGSSEEKLQGVRKKLDRPVTLVDCSKSNRYGSLSKEVERWKKELVTLISELSLAERAHSLLVSAQDSQPAEVPSTASDRAGVESESTAAVTPTEVDGWQLTLNRIANLTSSLWRESLENFALSINDQSNASSAPVIDLDALLNVIAQGCRNIRQVRLPMNHTTGTNFNMLHSIAKCCPVLEYIELQMDLTTLPKLPDKSGATFGLLHGLKTLSVNSDTSVDDRRGRLQLARYINLLFPNLEALLSPECSHAAEMWNDVHDQIKLFQLIREDDRCRGLPG